MTEKSQLKNFYDLIEYQGKEAGDKPYILHEDLVISFAEFDYSSPEKPDHTAIPETITSLM